MGTQVCSCPKCFRLMWIKEEQFEYLDESTIRVKCPHCQQMVRFTVVTQGATATGPKMGH